MFWAMYWLIPANVHCFIGAMPWSVDRVVGVRGLCFLVALGGCFLSRAFRGCGKHVCPLIVGNEVPSHNILFIRTSINFMESFNHEETSSLQINLTPHTSQKILCVW